MAIDVRDLRGLEGPNLYYGQPAVKLQLWSDRDIRSEIANTIKTWAQVTGTVIGSIQQVAQPEDEGYLITTTFTTPFPNVGERLLEGVVADIEAAERNDPEYSHDDLLFEVMRQRKREEPSLPLLQIYAEARARDLPFLPHEDGKITVGSGARGFTFDPSGLSLGLSVDVPWDQVERVPIIAITGTNGKTTTARLCAHILHAAGYRVGHTDTDGITIDGELVEEGDWAGFGGARRVLTDPRVEVAVLETSRGGILRRGLGFDLCDVSVITNVSSDHLGELGVNTLDELAHVKGVIALATRFDGRAVLNAGDPHVAGLAPYINAPILWFTREADQPLVQEHLVAGGDAVWSDGALLHSSVAGSRSELALDDIPIVVGGAAIHNVENVLAATGACLALGVAFEVVAAALRTFGPSERDNYGRLNMFRAHGITVILDYAHNEAGLSALLHLGKELCSRDDGRLIVMLGGPGDRMDAQMIAQGRLAGAAADLLLLHDPERYRRGREAGETPALYRQGAEEAGMPPDRIIDFPDEVVELQHALGIVRPGDVIVAAAHAQRDELIAMLHAWEQAAAAGTP
jgi:cyanophycin synthetase